MLFFCELRLDSDRLRRNSSQIYSNKDRPEKKRESGPILGHFRERQAVQPAGSPDERQSLHLTNVSLEKTFRMIKILSLKIDRVWTMAASILFCLARSSAETLAEIHSNAQSCQVCYLQIITVCREKTPA